MSTVKAQIMDEGTVTRALKRISHEILEKNGGAENLYIVGVKRRGIPLAEIIAKNIQQIEGKAVEVGSVDITLYRDDLTEISPSPVLGNTSLKDVVGKSVILVDDVLYTGRTARAALEAVLACGRPANIQLAVLVDRGHRELPIRGDYVGKNVPTSNSEMIAVKVPPYDDYLAVELYDKLG